MANKNLIIMRGVPGSGKSHLAESLATLHNFNPSEVICSADHYFMVEGVYAFDPKQLEAAHVGCQDKAECLMKESTELVIIDNTNVLRKHMKPYLDLAAKYGYRVQYLLPMTSWAWDADECYKRNTHNVPLSTIQRMLDTFQF